MLSSCRFVAKIQAPREREEFCQKTPKSVTPWLDNCLYKRIKIPIFCVLAAVDEFCGGPASHIPTHLPDIQHPGVFSSQPQTSWRLTSFAHDKVFTSTYTDWLTDAFAHLHATNFALGVWYAVKFCSTNLKLGSFFYIWLRQMLRDEDCQSGLWRRMFNFALWRNLTRLKPALWWLWLTYGPPRRILKNLFILWWLFGRKQEIDGAQRGVEINKWLGTFNDSGVVKVWRTFWMNRKASGCFRDFPSLSGHDKRNWGVHCFAHLCSSTGLLHVLSFPSDWVLGPVSLCSSIPNFSVVWQQKVDFLSCQLLNVASEFCCLSTRSREEQ